MPFWHLYLQKFQCLLPPYSCSFLQYVVTSVAAVIGVHRFRSGSSSVRCVWIMHIFLKFRWSEIFVSLPGQCFNMLKCKVIRFPRQDWMTHVMHFWHRLPCSFSQLTDDVPDATCCVWTSEHEADRGSFCCQWENGSWINNYKTAIWTPSSSPELSSDQKFVSTSHVD